MTVAHKVTVLTGASGSSYVGFTPAVGSLCTPAMNLEDGPAGVGDGLGNNTQLPAPVDVVATWDTSAERLYGQVIGAEQAAKGSSVDLGPTVSIVRDPRWGLAGDNNTNSTKVEVYTCNGTGAQVWHPQSDGALLNPQSGKCLDDTGSSTTPGTQVQIWSCTGAANQSWVQP
jgi:Ricin-type beta-trefoil lectin domain/Glycosyl hydrolase family 3 N terminal domain